MPKVWPPGCWRSWALKGDSRYTGYFGAEIRAFMKGGMQIHIQIRIHFNTLQLVYKM